LLAFFGAMRYYMEHIPNVLKAKLRGYARKRNPMAHASAFPVWDMHY
jgi:hypothetical protein